jgi:hypothetical protein
MRLPCSELNQIREFLQFELRNSSLKFWGLVRCDVAGPLENLFPISSRAEQTSHDYKLCKSVGTFKLPGYNFDTLASIESRTEHAI